MMNTDNAAGEAHDKAARRRIQTACEACRATKIRCQPSEKPGVCRKCLDSKRECISRTGPRTRRSNKARQGQESPSLPGPLPPSNPPSSTFSINFDVPAPQEADDSFDILRETHEQAFDSLLPAEDSDFDFAISPDGSGGGGFFPTPPASSTTGSHSIEDLHGKPQFNLASAESLLESFRSMLNHLPCIILPSSATVPQLAAQKPFLLLAILAAASGSKTLQGHSLYDAEFRKVLGLKFVAGGERSLELLQGLIIYCAWYPFHLRPKNKQVFHYSRMASDLIQDLELDQEPPGVNFSAASDEQLEGIRAYLAHSYMATSFTMAWRRYKNLTPVLTAWTATCADILQRHARVDGDVVLANLVRFSSVVSDASSTILERQGQTEQQRKLVMLGLETQVQALQQQIPGDIATNVSIATTRLFVDIFMSGGSLTEFPRPRDPSHSEALPLTPSRLEASVGIIRSYLDYIQTLEEAAFSNFIAVDWSRLVVVIIVGLRLCFRLPECPQFNHIQARDQLRVGEFLDHMCTETDLTPSKSKVDVMSASRVVLKVVKAKYDRRLEQAVAMEVAMMHELEDVIGKMPRSMGCPMLDGSLDNFLPVWDASFAPATTPPPASLSGGGEAVSTRPVFHDLWATMTMGWANEEEGEGEL